MTELHTFREQQARAEQQRAVRALLAEPLLTAQGPGGEDFVLVRRHAQVLRDFFAEHVGWTLHVDRRMARLRKVHGTSDDATRPARSRPKDPAFSRRRYVLTCLSLAVLERSDRQITLQRIADAVKAMVAEDEGLRDAGIEFALEGRDQRRDLVAAVRWLLARDVLRRVEGEEEAFLSDQGDVLYQVDRSVLAWLLGCARPPSTARFEGDRFASRLAALNEELDLGSDESRRRGLKHRLVRRLLDDPVLYYDELSEEELDYLTRSRAPILRRLADMTGLVAEIRAEGIALVDPQGALTDLGLPEEGTDGHATLLVAEHLADWARHGEGPMPVRDLYEHVRELAQQHRRVWRKGSADPGAEVELAERALGHLEGLALVRRDEHGITPRPAIGRYALGDASAETCGAPEPPTAQEELFR